MRRLASRVFAFVMPLILAAYLFDYFISKQLARNGQEVQGEYPTWNALYDGKINSDVVIYGSSRAWVHFDPAIIASKLNATTFNLGIDGHNFWMEYFRHFLLLKYNKKPHLIIQSLDVFTLMKRKDLYNSVQFLPYMLFNNDMRRSLLSFEGFNTVDFYVPLIRYSGREDLIINVIKDFIGPGKNVDLRKRGYKGQNRPWNDGFNNVWLKNKYHQVVIDTASINLFDRFLNECKAKNIKIVLVYPPEYIEGQKFIINRDKIMILYKKFSKKYNVPFYDYSNDTLSYNKKYFYNRQHLNKTGAEIFTNNFIGRLKEVYP